MAFRILVAEDEDISRKHIVNTLIEEGYNVEGVTDGLRALEKIRSGGYDLLVADIKMPGMDGLTLLEKTKEHSPETDAIIVTGFGSIGSAVEAMKRGAYDYLTKPFNLDELLLKVRRVRDRLSINRENAALKASVGLAGDIPLIAESPGMKRIAHIIAEMSGSDCEVLLTGESGTGKNLLARVIRKSGPRAQKPFLSINCATLTGELLSSELFGFEKGAFTGANTLKHGLMEVADGGTLYLDEIAEMPGNLQARLLTAIEEKTFYRVGGTRPINVDVRFIAATNLGIHQAVESGAFRRDLYYRLNVMEIHIPPLRERKQDIKPLCRHFLKKHLTGSARHIRGFSREALTILQNYSFPGNVRELENIVERALILEKSPLITLESLPKTLRSFQIETVEADNIKTLEMICKEYAAYVVELLGGNKAEAARVLGISRTSLWRTLKKD